VARLFDDASSQYLTVGSAVLTAAPITMACWFNTDDDTVDQMLMVFARVASTTPHRSLRFAGADNTLRFVERPDAGGNYAATSTSTISANTWHHCCGISAAANDRRVLLDGGNKGTESTNIGALTTDYTDIGGRHTAGIPDYASGCIAEAGIWNVALTDEEVAILAKGYSPLLVRPQNLVAYWPLIRDTDDDIVGGFSMTPVNSPTVAAHPRVFYPAGPYMVPMAAAIAALRIPRHPAAYFGGPTIF